MWLYRLVGSNSTALIGSPLHAVGVLVIVAADGRTGRGPHVIQALLDRNGSRVVLGRYDQQLVELQRSGEFGVPLGDVVSGPLLHCAESVGDRLLVYADLVGGGGGVQPAGEIDGERLAQPAGAVIFAIQVRELCLDECAGAVLVTSG